MPTCSCLKAGFGAKAMEGYHKLRAERETGREREREEARQSARALQISLQTHHRHMQYRQAF